MAERKDPSLDSGSLNPLFNKMDALLSRHRGRSGEQIPVLTDEASVMQIPTLTEEIRHDHTVMKITAPAKQDLMFHPAEFAWLNPDAVPASDKPKEPDPPLVEIPKLYPTQVAPLPDPAAPSVILDLPVLNLNALMPEAVPEPVMPSFELEIDEHEVHPAEAEVAAPVIAETIQIETVIEAKQSEAVEELAIVATPLAEDSAEVQTAMTAPAAIEHPIAQAKESAVDEPLLITHAPTPEEYLIDLDSVANEHDLSVSGEHTASVQEIVAKQADEANYELDITAAAPQEPEEVVVQAVSDNRHFEEITAVALPEEPIAEIVIAPAVETVAEPAPVAAPRLDAATIDDITAHVGAHIAVDITTEVAQLARQHFTRIMNGYYQQALQQLTEEISRDMETLLAPRITALVKQELEDRGLIDKPAKPN